MIRPAIASIGIKECSFGERVKIIEPVNIYGAVLEDEVFVGPFVEIQKGVTIGNRTRIQSHTFICELVTIGADCFIGHGVMFINDSFILGAPARGNTDLWRETVLGDNVSVGSNATLLPVKIASNTVIGAGSVVVDDIEESGVYVGNPARRIRGIKDVC